MSSILKLKSKRDKRPYDKENLKRAFQATLSGMSVYRASRVYDVPESTLRDRTRHNVSLDCKPGPTRLLSDEEEKKLMEHIVYMANIGYGYTIGDIQYMAADYARSLGKDVKAKEGLSQGWFYAFIGRWEELKVVYPQKLGMARAKCASKETIAKYFHELETVLSENSLFDAPEKIFNIDESGLSTEHAPPKIVCSKESTAQAVTSARTKNVTVIGGANAIGNHIPPFYIFPGKRWSDNLLEGAAPGSAGGMSESGWINRGLFETYMTEHFAKHVSISVDGPATLVLYDGHKSHISLTLTNWARERNVVLFVLPPHSSHLTQPLDVGVFGPMKKYYYQECKSYMHSNPGVSITRYEVAKLTARPYAKAFSPDNIISAFRKSGIYPFDNSIISDTQTAPALIYTQPSEKESEPVTDSPSHIETETANIKTEINNHIENPNVQSFLDSRKITTIVQRPKKKFIPPIKVSGNLMSQKNVDKLTDMHEKRKSETTTDNKTVKINKPESKTITSGKTAMSSSRPSTSDHAKTSGGPIDLESSSSESDDDEPCCVCKKSFPPQLRGCDYLVIVKWGQCDYCGHWVHLTHCTEVRVLRRGSTFRCVHCPEE